MDNSRFGFEHGDLETVIRVLKKTPVVKKAVIFGSRAKGNYQKGSDVDIAIWTIHEKEDLLISMTLNYETLLPYKFDVLFFNDISSNELKDHINRVGVQIYNTEEI